MCYLSQRAAGSRWRAQTIFDFGTITKRPRVRGRFSFYAFRAAGGLSRTSRAFNLFRFPSISSWPSFSWRSSLLLALSPNRNNGNRQMNAA
jgi:hypothetical protein